VAVELKGLIVVAIVESTILELEYLVVPLITGSPVFVIV
jgi:hypothetical protein